MNSGEIVADASAILALLRGEPFDKFDPRRLVHATVSAVNFSEILEKLCSGGLSEADADEAAAALDLRVVAFDEAQARDAARLRPLTRQEGLSLGDRACLALGNARGCPVVTADRAWASLKFCVEVVLIR